MSMTGIAEHEHGARNLCCWLFICLISQAGCADTSSIPEHSDVTTANETAERASTPPSKRNATADIRSTETSAPATESSTEHSVSKVLGKHDRTLSDGRQVCDVDFVYAGREPEDISWEEPCTTVTTRMVGRSALEAFEHWSRLDLYQQRFVANMPGGLVLYVEGKVSSSIYPIDETGMTIEVAVAD